MAIYHSTQYLHHIKLQEQTKLTKQVYQPGQNTDVCRIPGQCLFLDTTSLPYWQGSNWDFFECG